jgi:hypothetical protein
VALGLGPEQNLGYRQADEFGVGELGWTARNPLAMADLDEQVVDFNVECSDEGVERLHEPMFDTLSSSWQLLVARPVNSVSII